jgi:hypothetical protein
MRRSSRQTLFLSRWEPGRFRFSGSGTTVHAADSQVDGLLNIFSSALEQMRSSFPYATFSRSLPLIPILLESRQILQSPVQISRHFKNVTMYILNQKSTRKQKQSGLLPTTSESEPRIAGPPDRLLAPRTTVC